MAAILVVEDDPTLRLLVSRALDGASHHTRALDSVGAAIDAVATCPPDLVITDVNLPDGSGLELVRGIRTRFGDRIGVIVISGVGLAPSDAARSGADLFVEKPFMTGDLVRQCEMLLHNGVLDEKHRGQA